MGLSSPTTLFFNCSTGGIMPVINRSSINLNNDDDHYEGISGKTKKD